MESFLAGAALVAAVGGIAFFAWERYDFARAQVLGELGRLHATRIELSLNWADGDRDTVSFNVEYSTPDGKRHANECKVPTGAGGVYWARPLKGAA
jgi:hypothetical protein